MAPDVINLFRRASMATSEVTSGLSETMTKLLVALMVLLIVAVLLSGGLLILRQRRKTLQARSMLPYNDGNNNPRRSTSSVQSFHRRTHARPASSIHVFREKQMFEETSESPPNSSKLPEIRITFPEEVDAAGKRQSGHVVVVRVGDTNFGLEPVSETLPAYQQTECARFKSIDLERMSGLVEKDAPPPLGWN